MVALAALALAFSLQGKAAAPGGAGDELQTLFSHPPASAKPQVLWMWMGSNLSRKGITKDLEALKAAGFGGTTMFSLADVTTPWAGEIGNSPTPNLISWTEPWWALVRYAAQESKRLGLDFGMFNGPSYESSGGPWITPENSMQEICYSATRISGPGETETALPRPVVDPRAVESFPVYNPLTDKVEKPVIPARRTYYRDIAVIALPATGAVPKDRVIDLTTSMGTDGTLHWVPPAGDWTVYRFGHTTRGTLIQPAQWKATGLECDKMNPDAVRFHLRHVVGEIQRHLGDLIGTGFTHVHFDSYEAGTPNWTPKMAAEFSSRRGYSLLPYLATFAGRTVGSEAETGRFHRDFDATVEDLYAVYFRTIKATLAAAHLEFMCEPYGGPWRQDEVMPTVDRVVTEFWTDGGRYFPFEVNSTIAALRKSGQNVIEAEAFTGKPEFSPWTETPAWLKPIGDAAFCAGINRLVLHRFVQQPWDDRYLPGATMGQWGTHFDRTQTWWKPGRAMVEYWQRCQALLQYGRIAPDGFDQEATPGVQLQSIHRKGTAGDVWFVANLERTGGTARLSFETAGRQPEVWDPVTGERRDVRNYSVTGSTTSFTLDFAPTQSAFVVFRKPATATASAGEANSPTLQPVSALDGPWTVEFDPRWGGPKAVAFDRLEDWTTRPEAGIRYYSGTATYRKTFDAPGQGATTLDLGVVNHIARVRLNGRDLGVVWCAPWRLDLPAGVLKATGNAIEVEVTNVWANRLIGDEQEPSDMAWSPGHMGNGGFLKRFPDWFLKGAPRPSKGRFAFTTWNYFTKDSKLVPSGLLGPVRLMRKSWGAASPDPFAGQSLSIRTRTSPFETAFEGDVATMERVPVVEMAEEKVANSGGGTSAAALGNLTTKNGSGGDDDSQNDGRTYRGYGEGSVLTLRLDLGSSPGGYDLTGIQSFAGHQDARAGQRYGLEVSFVGRPNEFVPFAQVRVEASGGSSEVWVRARGGGLLERGAGGRASGVAAVRFRFGDGPLGWNVYREIAVLGRPTPKEAAVGRVQAQGRPSFATIGEGAAEPPERSAYVVPSVHR